MRVVVFGATGYIGGRLVPELLAAGHEVRVLARRPETLSEVPWRGNVETMAGDVTNPDSVAAALAGQEVLYYLVHSLNRRDFVAVDRRAATIVAAAAAPAGLCRIVYLGGITPAGHQLSPHLSSRTEVGAILREASGVPTAELRAAVILGSGSASFEMLRYLTERLPAMITPRWVGNRIQPIAVRDVLYYLVHAATLPEQVRRTFDIGGPDVLTYLDMMRKYAVIARLPRRVIVPVPVLSPWLSAQWVNLITPVPRSIAVPLMESLIHEVICEEHDIAGYIADPRRGLTHFERAVELALARIRDADVPTRWSDATAGVPSDPLPTDPDWSGGSLYQDIRERHTAADPDTVWNVIESIGGDHGWYSFPLAWSVRGWIDKLAGGVGLRRGRRDPHRLHPGEALDWWRVEQLDRPHLLRLRVEMRVPGRAWLELSAVPDPRGGTLYRQRAVFEPHGLAGHAYWKAIDPFHDIVFGGMARNITGTAEANAAARQQHS
jgi:uncharacterized protein YbjT (DUF2867 family)